MASTTRSTRTPARAAAARSRAASKTGTPPQDDRQDRHARKTTTKPANGSTPKPLIRAQQALDHAARTEKQPRSTLKKHTKTINTAKDDLDAHAADLKNLKSQLKTAKKARKQTAKKLRTDAAAKTK
jgi:hypothetical protein